LAAATAISAVFSQLIDGPIACALLAVPSSVTHWKRCRSRIHAKEELMKKLVFFILLISTVLWAQDKTSVTVKSSQVTSGVVLITISENGKTFDLQCNDGHAYCKTVKPGDYQMVRLAKNHGMCDCQNVDLYPKKADTAQEEKLGEYCLNE
jgi:hypothetical protein